MNDPIKFVKALRRPNLLIRAARFGLADYNRARALRKFTRSSVAPNPLRALSSLLGLEASLEEARRSGDASYSVARHVEVLIALMAETRLVARPQQAQG